jgi:uncharacterized protein YndB with AHSA1/START domain
MTNDLYGALRLDDERPAVRFERTFTTDPHDLWDAITDPARLARWFATVVGDLSPGGAFTIVFDDGSDPDRRTEGSVRTCQPPELLEIAWSIAGEPDSSVHVELRPSDDVREATVLVLDHRRLPTTSAAGHAAGWHCYVEALERHVRGDTTEAPTWDERWSELVPAYRDQLATTTA